MRTSSRPTLETLVDSPLLAGKYYKRIALDERRRARSTSTPSPTRRQQLEVKPEILEATRRWSRRPTSCTARATSQHYHFLPRSSERYAGIGLEHQQSTEVGVAPTT